MNTSQTAAAARAGSPPPRRVERTPPPRFPGPAAELGSLQARLRSARQAGDEEAEARLSGLLARALAGRGVDTREALRLAERALALGGDGALATELSAWWAGVGEPARAAAILQRVEARTSPDDRGALWVRIGVLLARAGKARDAAEAFDTALLAAPKDPLPAELLGTLRGWGAISSELASQAFHEAANRRLAQGDETGAFENCIRAFEACPSDATAAERLAGALEERERFGAAEEVLREQARSGSAAHRAATHQRRFERHLKQGDLHAALGAALEAELDVAFGVERLGEVLRSNGTTQPADVEGLFVSLARQDPVLAEWLLAALDAAVFVWGAGEVQRLRGEVLQGLIQDGRPEQLPPEIALGEGEIQRRSAVLREQLLRMGDAPQERVRLELARLQAARGAWLAAQEVLAPLLLEERPALEAACLAAVVAVRAGKPETRARALLQVARHSHGRVKAVVASVAAELLLELGLTAEARSAAALAVEADAAWPRAVAAQALVAQRDPDSAAAALLERSLAVVLARTQACRILADSSERRGALRLALTWTQRQLSQKPGEPDVVKELLRRAAAAGDGERLADALSWLLSQPLPISKLTTPVAEALQALVDLAAERAPDVARRVLDVMGPRADAVREAVLHVARRCALPELEAQVLERWLVTAPAEVRPGALVELARLRAVVGDVASAARSLGRALAAGAPAEPILEQVAAFPEATDSEAILAVCEVRAEALARLAGSVPAAADSAGPSANGSASVVPDSAERLAGRSERSEEWFEALRQCGAARWDLAGDSSGAVEVWSRMLDPEDPQSLELMARDLTVFAGAEGAAKELERFAASISEAVYSGRLYGLAARSALEAQVPDLAFRLAREALARHPANTDVLTIAESAASSSDLDELVVLYRTLANATLGRYGERAVHYRAARQLEQRGRHDAALHHAIAAFEAVPAEGVAFVLMARLSDRAGASDQVVGALERVASRARDDASRVLWLERAAALADTSDSGRRQRIDVLLRALAVRPDAATLGTLVEAMRQLVAVCPEESDVVQLRFERALGVLLPKAGGMEGGLFALRAAVVALEMFGADELALRAVQRAAACDSDLEEFTELQAHVARLVAVEEPARELVSWCAGRAGKKTSSMGRSLAELAAALAEALGEREAQARLLVRAAAESPEDTNLVRSAQRLARQVGDPDLLATIEHIVPADDRARQVLEQAAQASVDEALDLLLDVELEPLSLEVRRSLLEALAQRQEEIGRVDDAEASYKALLALDAENVVALAGLERAAERRNDHDELARLLLRRAECSPDAEQALRIRLRRASVLDRGGRAEEARQELERLLSDSGDRTEVLESLAELYSRAGGPSRAATLWGRAAAASQDPRRTGSLLLFAAQAHLAAGELDAARRSLEGVRLDPEPLALLELRVQLARQGGDRRALVAALGTLAERTVEAPENAAALLVEAAQMAEEIGQKERALELAVRAAELTPRAPEAQLLARRLEYLTRGAGTAEQARGTVEQLRGLSERLTHRQIELRAFLLAEALDLVEGGGAGLRELDRAVDRVGSRALVAVGLAERLEDDPRRALQLLDAALGSDLHGLLGEGQVLIRAGRVARALGELDRAQAYLSAVAHDDPRQVEAAAELREIAAERRAREESERQAREEAERRTHEESERRAREARAEQERREAAERRAREESERQAREEAERRTHEESERRAREEGERRAREESERQAREARAEQERREAAERQAREARAEQERREAAERQAREEAEREAREESERQAREARAEQERREAAERQAREEAERRTHEESERQAGESERQQQEALAERKRTEAKRLLQQRSAPSSGRFRAAAPASGSWGKTLPGQPASEREGELRRAFEDGDVVAGRALLEILAADGGRAHERLFLAERLAMLLPGDEYVVRQLVLAAEAERNGALAAAVRHVLGTFGVVPLEVAPEVSRLREQSEEVRRILTGGLNPGLEAMGVVWENVPNLFKQEPSAYGITGVERVAAGPLTPLSRLYADAGRLLGTTRTPVFQRRGAEAITLSVALLVPPALLVTGEVDEYSTELAFHFGAMLMATAPEFALVFGAEPGKVRLLLEALVAAFGPPRGERARPEATRLGALLWESIPPRGQRRLSQLCAEPEELAYEKVTAQARQVLRRAGLMACADLATAVVAACEEERLPPPRTLSELGECCERSAAVADLVRLALSPEYAEVRWNAG